MDRERELQYSAEGQHFETRCVLTITYRPPADVQTKIAGVFLSGAPSRTDWSRHLDWFKQRLREFGDAFAHAATLAPQHGAGTLVYVGRFDVAEFAVVLEPADPLIRARRVFYAGMGALADAIAGAAPPETAIHIKWPDALYVNWGFVGGGRLAWPESTGEAEQ